MTTEVAPAATEAVADTLPLLMRPEEVAHQLGCGRAYVYELLARGELRSVKVGRLRRIPATVLREYVDGLAPGSTGCR